MKRVMCILAVALAGACSSNTGGSSATKDAAKGGESDSTDGVQADTAESEDDVAEADGTVEDTSGGGQDGSDGVSEDVAPPGPDLEPPAPAGIKTTSTGGTYELWLEGVDAGLTKNQLVVLPLTIHVAGAPAIGLTADVTFIHKSMGHGSSKLPAVEEPGEGRYEIVDVLASMAGTWELSVTLSGGETAVWEIEVD